MGNGTHTEQEAAWARALDGLSGSLARLTAARAEVDSVVPGLAFYRHEAPTAPLSCLYEPTVCVVAQGVKCVTLGEERYVYDARNYLISSLHLSGFVQILEASPARPYLGLALRLDLGELAALVLDSQLPPPRRQAPRRGMATGEASLPLISAFQRLVDLQAEPEDVPILAPVIRREIFYRLLVGEQGGRLRQMATAGSQPHQIALALDWLRTHFREPLAVEALATRVGMSASSFYHHFRAITALSPLQFQKQLRLQEARRLMLEGHLEAATAAFQVGYESPSQFSREYARLFGEPPLRSVTRFRQAMAGERLAPA
ncbi:MAG: AraC family transcriptional regulator [Candidatus Dactylopiibacterium sp.]|nr:AraC family transcriptional regulator [Candidatus Dactylopiibacterium sp.]